MNVTNIDKGPRGLNTKSGPVLIDIGQTIEGVEIEDAELKVAKATGWFDFGSKPAPKAEKE